MSLKIPNWINAELFRNFLEEILEDFIEITKFHTFSAQQAEGENEISAVLRIKIAIKTKADAIKQLSFILKIPILSNSNAVNEYHDLFVTENEMYASLLPELEKIYAIYKRKVDFNAKYFAFQSKAKINCDYVLLEDLSLKGYQNVSRLKGFDEEHTKAALAKLAKLHAASAKRVELYGEYAKHYKHSYFTEENRAVIDKMNTAFLIPFRECLKSYNLSMEQKKKIGHYMQQLTNAYMKCGKVDENNFNVLNHGDFWLNNIMFQYEPSDLSFTERIIRVTKFVDFQLPKYGSPAQDLLVFLMTTPAMTIRLTKFDYFIQYYYEVLMQHLGILEYGLKLPTLQDLEEQLRLNSMWAFIGAQRMLAITLLDPSDNSNNEMFLSNNLDGVAYRRRIFYNPSYVKQIEIILPWLIERKFMEIL